MYELLFLPSAARDARRLTGDDRRRVREATDRLRNWPAHGGDVCKVRARTEGEFRLRVGDYRVLFDVDAPNRRILIVRIRRRERAYRD